MRPFLAAAGMAVVLFSGAACTSESDSAETTAGRGTPGATKEAGPDNTAQVCAEVKRLNTATPRTLTASFKAAVDTSFAGSSEADTKADTKADLATTLKQMLADTRQWIEAVQQQRDAATDPALATALTGLVTELDPLRKGHFTLKRMNEVVRKSRGDLAPYCGDTAAVTRSTKAGKGSRSTGVGPGTACPAPIAFDTAKKWKPQRITGKSVSGIPLIHKGLTLLCEIDAEPAGLTGFMRVWKVEKTATPRIALLEVALAFKAANGLKYKEITVGGQAALEATYISDGTPGRAFAVTLTSGEIVVTDWRGSDKEEHQGGLPAYDLARSSLTFP
jgi:hypothetical protein